MMLFEFYFDKKMGDYAGYEVDMWYYLRGRCSHSGSINSYARDYRDWMQVHSRLGGGV